MAEKTFAQKEAIRKAWSLRRILNQIQTMLPAGYTTTNKKPVQKEIQRLGSSDQNLLWSTWCKDAEGNTFLALWNGKKVKLLSEEQLKEYKLRSIAD